MTPIHKFNNGNKATLCNFCSVIITQDHTSDLYCKTCLKQEVKNPVYISSIDFPLIKVKLLRDEKQGFFLADLNYRDPLEKGQIALNWFLEDNNKPSIFLITEETLSDTESFDAFRVIGFPGQIRNKDIERLTYGYNYLAKCKKTPEGIFLELDENKQVILFSEEDIIEVVSTGSINSQEFQKGINWYKQNLSILSE